jgi:hypothetical protein
MAKIMYISEMAKMSIMAMKAKAVCGQYQRKSGVIANNGIVA